MTPAGPRSACIRGVRPGAPGCESRARPTPRRAAGVWVCAGQGEAQASPGDRDNTRNPTSSTIGCMQAVSLCCRRRYGSDVQGVQQMVEHEGGDALTVGGGENCNRFRMFVAVTRFAGSSVI